MTETELVQKLRNSIHHSDERILKAEPRTMPGVPPLWGTLECLAPSDSTKFAKHASLTPGTRTFKWASSAVGDCPYPKAPVDHIAITAFGVELSLTRTHGVVERLARGLEAVAPRVRPELTFADMLMLSHMPYDLGAESADHDTDSPAPPGVK